MLGPPTGSRSELRASERREKLSLVSAAKVDGELLFSVHGHNLTGSDTIHFLRRRLGERTEKNQKFLIVWDNVSIHKSGNVRRFLERNRAAMRRLFPPYAPGLNPDEPVWNLAKYHDLANWCPKGVREMCSVINREMRTLSSQRERVASAIREAEIPLPMISRH